MIHEWECPSERLWINWNDWLSQKQEWRRQVEAEEVSAYPEDWEEDREEERLKEGKCFLLSFVNN